MPKNKRKPRIAEIVDFEDTEVYRLLQKEKLLKNESEVLSKTVLAKLHEKTYRSTGVNKQAALIWEHISSITVLLNEQLKAIDYRIAKLNSDSRESAIKKRVELLTERNSLLGNAIGQFKPEHANLSALENELYPVSKADKGNVFLQNKNTVAEIYVNLKQHVTAIRFELDKYDDTELQEAIKPDVEQLDKLLAETDAITHKTVEIHEKSKGGVISSDLFAEMANQLHELAEKKFDIEQRCKLIEDRLAIAKLDRVIAEQTIEIEKVYNNLSSLYGIVYMAATQGHSRYSDLSKELKSLIIADGSRSKLSFSAENFQPQIPLSSMYWND
ncbi:hypothetical protein TUM19329_18350 [Legionella antarctica]|uniref:Uncharacterized protein n=1 Tax=Legionella antarctica TaxID=2708020 RepID=A0A6F8T459_9GAMM|nr:hypothetical protein [Legionella antarctica]BCA95474.1 hypothetical protein TUM19329_18350 [Legionella antarctica]